MNFKDKLDRMYADIGRSEVAGIVPHLCFESPIEEMLLAALVFEPWTETDDNGRTFDTMSRRFEYSRHRDTGRTAIVATFRGLLVGFDPFWALLYQPKVGPYRLDFGVVGHIGKIAIECDGHDFHEKTKDQAARDKKRDRYLQKEGWRVLRFTGSEIYKDAHACATEVQDMMDTLEAQHAEVIAKADGEVEP